MHTGSQTIRDADGQALAEGMTVRVLALAPDLLDGLDPEDVAYLVTVPGTLGWIDEVLDGDVSVMLRESTSRWHFIRSPGDLLRHEPGGTVPWAPWDGASGG